MSPAVEVFSARDYPARAAALIAQRLYGDGAVVLTGGGTAERVYPHLAELGVSWLGRVVLFSDERAVPPDDPASNYGMAVRTLGPALAVADVRRMRGEDDPDAAARAYGEEVRPLLTPGPRLVVLGLGDDAHVAALFPRSRALAERGRPCVAVDRPDGLTGITLTPPALVAGREVVVIATGAAKADAVRRAVAGDEPVERCPARLLAAHARVTFALDDAAAADLDA